MSAKEDSLNFNEYGELALEGIIASIPSVGAALQTAYFGRKNEKRFKRIESFYNELSKDINKLHAQMATSEQIDSISNELSDFMEATNDIIESQSSLAKQSMLHNAFLNILNSPQSVNWSENRFFMSTVRQIDEIDLKIMSAIKDIPANRWATPSNVELFASIDHFFAIGLLERLTNFGYLEKRLGSITMNDTQGTTIDTYYTITNLGKRFLDFMMQPPFSANTQNGDN